MEFIKISGIIIVCILTVSFIPMMDKAVSSIISICICFVVLTYVLDMITPAIESIKNIFRYETEAHFTLIFKTMGIALVTQFVSDVAIDNGNKAIANQMILAGKTAIVILAMPVFIQVLEIIGQLIE